MTGQNEILRIENLSKAYPGVQALDMVNFNFRKGEIHALVGENGAGKSTLIMCISGAITPDSGKIIVDNDVYPALSPIQAKEKGIATVYQEGTLVPPLSIAENVFLGIKKKGEIFYSTRQKESDCSELLKRLDIHLNPKRIVYTLSSAQSQLVEIVRSISRNVKVLILDEPTSSLSLKETDFLFKTIRALKEEGVTIIYISHRLEEIFNLADRVSVMRDGQYIETLAVKDTSRAELINLMIGRELNQSYPSRNVSPGQVILEVKNLSGNGVSDISFSLREREILGFAGLVGAGRSELFQVVYGATEKEAGDIFLNGSEVRINSPQKAIANGFGLIPEDRKRQSLFLTQSVERNISVANLRKLSRWSFVNDRKARRQAEHYRELLRIKTPSLNQKAINLSGGNQQKVSLAKALAPKANILILDEPTRGVDVGAKQEIYKQMNNLVEEGNSILMISSEMPELIGMADRIVVMAEGKKAGELGKKEFNQQTILKMASNEE